MFQDRGIIESRRKHYLWVEGDPGLWQLVLETGPDPEMKAGKAVPDSLEHIYARPLEPDFLED